MSTHLKHTKASFDALWSATILRAAGFTAAALTLVTLGAMAQGVAEPAPASTALAPAAPVTGLPGWMVLIPVLVPMVIAGLKGVVPSIPRLWLPILAPVLGAAMEVLTNWQFSSGTLAAAVAGAAGVGLREIVDQLRTRARAEITRESSLPLLVVAGMCGAACLAGCTTARQYAREFDPTTGKPTREVGSAIVTTGNGSQAVKAMNASSGGKYAKVGTEEASQQQNSAAMISELVAGLRVVGSVFAGGVPGAGAAQSVAAQSPGGLPAVAAPAGAAAAAPVARATPTVVIDRTGFPAWYPDEYFMPGEGTWKTNALGGLTHCVGGSCYYYAPPAVAATNGAPAN